MATISDSASAANTPLAATAAAAAAAAAASASRSHASSNDADASSDRLARASPRAGFVAVNGINGHAEPQVNGRSHAAAAADAMSHNSPRITAGAAPTSTSSSTAQAGRRRSPSRFDASSAAGRPSDASAAPDSPSARKRTYPEAFGVGEGPAPYAASSRSAKDGTRHSGSDGLVDGSATRSEYGRSDLDREDRDRRGGQRNLHADYDSPTTATAAAAVEASSQPYYGSRLAAGAADSADQELADALRRGTATAQMGSEPEQTYGTPDADESAISQSYADFASGRSITGAAIDDGTPGSVGGASGVGGSGGMNNNNAAQTHPDGKRKRIFSNRTKTGCLTCRKRKKKCDEQHPQCNNCLRGGFVCEGYVQRGPWQKPGSVKSPIALQSKTGVDGDDRSYPDAAKPYGALSGASSRRLNDQPHDSSPIDRTWHGTPPAYGGTPGSYKYNDRPDATPDYPEQTAYGPRAPHSHGPGTPSSLTGGPSGAGDALPPSSRSQAYSTRRTQSRLAGEPSSPDSKRVPAPLSDVRRDDASAREEMMRGKHFAPFAAPLLADRDQCAMAVWRFNNAVTPNYCVPIGERMNLFRQILALRPTAENGSPPATSAASGGASSSVGAMDPTLATAGPSQQAPPAGQSTAAPTGSECGADVTVEAPFHCDYGYNIRVGASTLIGPGCRISDSCAVTIGSNVVMSAGVSLMSHTYPVDPRDRRPPTTNNGVVSGGRAIGREISIGNYCWLGPNVVVLPGVHIADNAIIGAGVVVSKDVPPGVILAGNPAKVARNVWGASHEDLNA